MRAPKKSDDVSPVLQKRRRFFFGFLGGCLTFFVLGRLWWTQDPPESLQTANDFSPQKKNLRKEPPHVGVYEDRFFEEHPYQEFVFTPDTDFGPRSSNFLHGHEVGRGLYQAGPKPSSDDNLEDLHRGYSYNSKASDAVDINRIIPDQRSSQCRAKSYEGLEIGATSVVIIFHNELYSALIRTAQSVLHRTEPDHLKEILLVDDASSLTDFPRLGEELETYVQNLPKTRLLRFKNHEGLMMARMLGVHEAKGETLSFMDSHCEVNLHWYPPLGSYLKKHPKASAMPIISSIHANSMNPEFGGIQLEGTNWFLQQDPSFTRPTNDKTDPQPSPIMAGGVFSVNRDWWHTLDGYDRELKYYGGEEVEWSMKNWLCGGSIILIPCSTIYHIFRSDKYWKGSAVEKPPDWVTRNYFRISAIWLEPEYQRIVNFARADLPAEVPLGDLSRMLEFKKRLNCHSFSYFLKNVQPEMEVPDFDGMLKGELRGANANYCVDTMQAKLGKPAGVFYCHNQKGTQSVLLNSKHQLLIPSEGYVKMYCPTVPHGMILAKSCEHGWYFQEDTGELSVQVDGQTYYARLNDSLTSLEFELEKTEPLDRYKFVFQGYD